jgi:2-oxoglutarate ferredoxin oxidoreductase subunit beta
MEQNKLENQIKKYTPKDFASDQDVRWCPGCGDYAILAAVQRTFAQLDHKKEDYVWISGIGCSSRFPYYMSTYGFHTIHGRAPAIATGLKVFRPELSVWVATGDGDGLSIGGNHFIHAARKNIDINVLLFNNKIYGLTKGQYSPTSEKGKISKSSPYGTVDHPFNPTSVAVGAEATFVARAIDRDSKHLVEVLKRADAHKGFSFIEIDQNCVIFNDGAFKLLTDKETRDDHVVYLEHGKPLIFGKNKDKGIVIDEHAQPIVVDLNEGKYTVDDLWVHDEHDRSPVRAFILAHMTDNPSLPTPLGIFKDIEEPTLENEIHRQIKEVTEMKGEGNLEKLLYAGNTWEIQ